MGEGPRACVTAWLGPEGLGRLNFGNSCSPRRRSGSTHSTFSGCRHGSRRNAPDIGQDGLHAVLEHILPHVHKSMCTLRPVEGTYLDLKLQVHGRPHLQMCWPWSASSGSSSGLLDLSGRVAAHPGMHTCAGRAQVRSPRSSTLLLPLSGGGGGDRVPPTGSCSYVRTSSIMPRSNVHSGRGESESDMEDAADIAPRRSRRDR